VQVYQLMKEQLGVERPLSELHPEVKLEASDEEPAAAAGKAAKAGKAEKVDVSEEGGDFGGAEDHDEL
jgi:hypothetical protein